MMPFVQHPAAWQEFEDAMRFHAAISPDLAVDFAAAVADHRGRICAEPRLYHVRNFGVRRVNLTPQFKEWFFAYILWQGQVVILAIGHAKRRPFYFRRRVGEARKLF